MWYLDNILNNSEEHIINLNKFEINTIEDSKELSKIYFDFFITYINQFNSNLYNNVKEKDKYTLLEMIFTKFLHIIKSLEGIDYNSTDNKYSFENFIDPTVINNNIRSVYENIAVFYMVYVYPNTEEEKLITYNLWCISGLENRKKFYLNIDDLEIDIGISSYSNKDEYLQNIKKMKSQAEDEKKKIEDYKKEIQNTSIYKKDVNRNRFTQIFKEIQNKFLFKFDKDEIIRKIDIFEIFSLLKINMNYIDYYYKFLSTHTHTSNLSVFQYQEYKNNNKYKETVVSSTQVLFYLISIFIIEYVKTDTNAEQILNNTDVRCKLFIDYQNVFARGHENCFFKEFIEMFKFYRL